MLAEVRARVPGVRRSMVLDTDFDAALRVPFAWRKRLGYDGPRLSALTRLFVKTVLDFYRERVGGDVLGQSGAVVAVQRTSSDLKLTPHVHAVFLAGGVSGQGGGAKQRVRGEGLGA